MDYHKCIACRKGWVNEKTAKDRLNWATTMLQKYPRPEDWHKVHFSDEVHFDYDTQDKLRIIRKAGMRYCQDCIEEVHEPSENDKKRYHCWAAIRHNFKSDIHFYEVPGNTNGKMSQQMYTEKILDKLSSHGFKLITILCWRRMEIRDMDRGSLTLCAHGNPMVHEFC